LKLDKADNLDMEIDQLPPEENTLMDHQEAPTADSWEDHSGTGTPATTPEDEDVGNDQFVPASKPR
jgi:hypothetical protein